MCVSEGHPCHWLRGCLPRGEHWPHTQALPRQRCVVNNRRAMTEGKHAQTQASIKVKDGCGCNGRALYRHVINTWGGFSTAQREEARGHVVSVDPDICISKAREVCMSPRQISRYDFSRTAESGDTCPHLLTLHILTIQISCWLNGPRSGVIITWFWIILDKQMTFFHNFVTTAVYRVNKTRFNIYLFLVNEKNVCRV